MNENQLLREAAKQAVDAFEAFGEADDFASLFSLTGKMNALHAALAQPAEGGGVVIDGDTSDGYHTFNELYEFRKAYNAALFNEWASSGKCNVHKSWRHYDGELCFGGGWFIVVAVLPAGQISNHYEAKDWDLFAVPESERALFEFDGHTGSDVISRLKAYAPPASQEQADCEPFGYFRPEPFGWTDCAETDEGAIALYERPAQAATIKRALQVERSDFEAWASRYSTLSLERDGDVYASIEQTMLWHAWIARAEKANAPEGALVGPVGAGVDFALKGVTKSTQSKADSNCDHDFSLDPKSSIWICTKCGSVERMRHLASQEQAQQPQAQAIKDNEIAQLVNRVRDIAIEFRDQQQLRERIAMLLVPVLKATQAREARAQAQAQSATTVDTNIHAGSESINATTTTTQAQAQELPPLPRNLTCAVYGPIWPLICQWNESDPGMASKVAQAIDALLVKLMQDYARAALAAKPVPDDVRKDAERYRWLRNKAGGWYIGPAYSTYNDVVCDGCYNDLSGGGIALDSAIDAAIAAQGGK